MLEGGAVAANQARHLKSLVRRNQRYTKIDAELRQIAGTAALAARKRYFQSLDGRKIVIPFARAFRERPWFDGRFSAGRDSRQGVALEAMGGTDPAVFRPSGPKSPKK